MIRLMMMGAQKLWGNVSTRTYVGCSMHAVIPTITGGAWITGRNELHFDENDPFVEGILRH